ncbi:Nuclease of RNase H fold, RuvC/YqgF family [Halanaeroarchaeum sp. HSR-CO]|uniref:hypothetical protein n=1 Tax=Halanaeroarchaeum sp. HSR-CO TaxID=2866382 RepID=UPI00217EF4DD|nr:hypothetical protein [Halanaeroarchaeum sp. HSR-CO]UWG48605.1 Nuclease of RNase H fold, RuvC/YqgF family [Halanaeroarchaeum sp. HSR-CO]
MIVVATENFEVYHDVVAALRARGSDFTTIRAGADLPSDAAVVIVGPGEDRAADVPIVEADPTDPRAAVDEAMAALRSGEGPLVVGVDPGTDPGIAVLHGDLVVAAFQVPIDDAAATIHRELDGSTDALVRLGDGARLHGARLLEELGDVAVELVDESGTSPHLGSGARGMGDVLAAVNIARRSGTAIEGRNIEPTEGEIQVIKSRSRERSTDNRTITEALARRVARGDLTLDEAIVEHGDAVSDDSDGT